MRNKETIQHEQGTTKKCRGAQLTMEGLNHLSEKQLDKLMEEEPEITIKGYLLFLSEIANIEKTADNGRESNDN